MRALAGVHHATDTTAVINTGDDNSLYRLAISPDIDTVTYTLASAIDLDRGWGLSGESWRAMDALNRYAKVMPSGSAAAPTWFSLGDQDLATHLYRTSRLAEGASLTKVTAEIAAAWGLEQRLLPMSDEAVSTMVTLRDEGVEVPFQEYFVKCHHQVAVAGLRFQGASEAQLTGPARSALIDSEVVVIAPSNPLVSIGPIRALPEVDKLLGRRRDSVVAISPIVGGVALKGPADRMMLELGHEPSAAGVARLYASIAATLVIDPVDEALVPAIEATGMRAIVTPSVMSDIEIGQQLARRVLAAGRE
ncbi:MAG: 2-phospho-L-lactate transferase [Actinobacteria bacterium]|nr:2-phospho-L-lactate transferase [Actinomycetota bacterium]